ncbi:hypothetical protein ITJ64_17255 [Herbiconiux sp. VKM Ac-1786]|jgi:hypothetical protein|uniref:hypothetical protein n=1 Tax=Herbiconiux sp. VKM Ac-1786 TaxID=2783824 RepID=UPI001889C3D0|nr:hypothetical protein [Herbiconiux sp. VKM Ac-1786]MBF4574261.1 hypothetical protein [Herbiconiux sp. VKM Ac-1786]
MEPFWIDIIALVAFVIVVVVALVVRRRLRGGLDYKEPTVHPADQPDHSQDARSAMARRMSDRTGFGAGGGL